MWVFIFDLEMSTPAGVEKISNPKKKIKFRQPHSRGGKEGWHSEIL
jgi:hypothetical protein